MSIHLSTGSAGAGAGSLSAKAASETPGRSEILAPMLAGARARGIADAFEMMGEAAILLDFSGQVLHVSERAQPLLGCALTIAGGHVVAPDRKTAAPLQRLLEAALATDGPAHLEEDLRCAEDGMRQRVRIYRPLVAGEAYQMLSAVLVLEPPRRVRRKAAPRGHIEQAA